jgi:hypothetical protein
MYKEKYYLAYFSFSIFFLFFSPPFFPLRFRTSAIVLYLAAAYVETEAGNREGLPEHLMDERL